jgi:ABC-type transport system involved in Fe-S cluster assembly fused permease/ATPase subunit
MASETTPMVLANGHNPPWPWSGRWLLTAASARARSAGSAPTWTPRSACSGTLNSTNSHRTGSCSRARSWTTSASAARAVGADQVIAGLPDGYDTQVGERGALLAAGERQLVAFARAWIADPALLILDEATSNLDAASEARITDALQRLRSGRTTIIIAHRLSTIAQADQIAVVSDGRIVESGTPAGLRARGGRFAELFDRWVAGAA